MRTYSAVKAAIAISALAGVPFCTSIASARITEIKIDTVEPFADGSAFGTVGPYVRIKGIAKGELDPKAPENATIVDLDKAPRNARGMVEYDVDIFILRPADPAKGNGILFYEALNRGNKQIGRRLHDVLASAGVGLNDPQTREHAGNGFLFERGYTMMWSGWDADVSRNGARMAARFPVALENGKPIVRRIREEIQVGKRGPAEVEVAKLNYPAASIDRSKARLTERARESDARVEVAPEQWEFASDRTIRLLPTGTKFSPVTIYELWYEATEPKVVGMGFAATRDVVSFLRYEAVDDRGTANPLASGRAAAVCDTLWRSAARRAAAICATMSNSA